MPIIPGMTLTTSYTVEEQHTAFHIGSGSVKVLGTPVMIAFMEINAMELMQAELDEGYSSVGTRVDIRHLAPSKIGARIKVTAEVTAVDGPKVTLKVEAQDGKTLVGTGQHWRYIIDIAEFSQLLEP